MARQAKKENTENMDATVPDQPDVETIASENTAENIVPQSEQNANTEEASAKADDFPSRASGAGANEGSGRRRGSPPPPPGARGRSPRLNQTLPSIRQRGTPASPWNPSPFWRIATASPDGSRPL